MKKTSKVFAGEKSETVFQKVLEIQPAGKIGMDMNKLLIKEAKSAVAKYDQKRMSLQMLLGVLHGYWVIAFELDLVKTEKELTALYDSYVNS